METAEFIVFEPDGKRFRFSRDTFLFILFGIGFAVVLPFQDKLKTNYLFENIIDYYFSGVFILTFYYILTSYFLYKPLYGELNGSIKFETNKIILNTKIYLLSDIEKLDMAVNDYYGERSIGKTFNQRRSQGIANFVTFVDDSGLYHKIFFKLVTKNHRESLYPFVNEAVKQNKMSVYRAEDIIGEDNIIK